MTDSSFFDRVYLVTQHIPWGRVTTYGAIAKYLGTAQSARMVGWALNKCFSSNVFIPAHRVVNRNGILTGKKYFGAEHVMRELLENEGAIIVNDQIINFETMFWDPVKEITLPHNLKN